MKKLLDDKVHELKEVKFGLPKFDKGVMSDEVKTEQEQIQKHLDRLNNGEIKVNTSKYIFMTVNFDYINPFNQVELVNVNGKWIKE